MKNTLKVLVAVAVLAAVAITVTVRASDPSPLASGVLPTYPKQTWLLPNGTIGAQIDANGGLGYIRGLQYVWPTAHANGYLIDNGSGTLTWNTGAVVSASMPLTIANGGTGTTNVANVKAALGFQSASAVSGSASNYTWTFTTAYSAAPIVVASPGQNVNVWISSVTTSNAVITTTATNVTLYLRAVGAP